MEGPDTGKIPANNPGVRENYRKEITTMAKLICLKRELRIRENTYPGLVKEGRMTKEQTANELAVMKAMIEDYTTILRCTS
jgi:hypothetical protein